MLPLKSRRSPESGPPTALPMPHADASLVPEEIRTKADFYEHVFSQLQPLIEDQRNWISNLSNAASLLYQSYLSFLPYFGSGDRAVNWAGFYLDASLFPGIPTEQREGVGKRLLLGPFGGKPACQFIRAQPGKGVCADAFISGRTVIVDNVETYPGHIACDGETKSEIVVPIMHNGTPIGVMDLDCLTLKGFSEEDRAGLENIVDLIVKSCDWYPELSSKA